ncbi:MAG TPA: GGDEF domain-containing protein [Bacillota bacterium]|jgi:diguanylate cyclase (GGDEF)-like protein|nr:GGDEF domain-containing protein [Bacillota bacterium]HOL11025.1 GGDEF domain-containing protein [Bacillota bacterium]
MKSDKRKKNDIRVFLNDLKKYKNVFYWIIVCSYFVAIFVLYPLFKTETFKITLIPLIYASFFYGYKGGILTMLLLDSFVFIYLSLCKVPFDSYMYNALTGKIIGISMIWVFGSLAKVILLNKELKTTSLCDSLTGLYNRRYYTEVVTNLVSNFTEEVTNSEVWKRDPNIKNKVIGICMVDIDNFKTINDEFGHDAGDQVLREISSIMKSILRFDDIVIRWGGEEFVILLNRTKVNYLPQFLRLLKTSISNHRISISKTQSIKVNVSGGCIAYPYYTSNPRGLSFEECINLADMLLYYAKKSGRNRLIMLKQIDPYLSYDELQTLLKSVTNEDEDFGANSQFLEII